MLFPKHYPDIPKWKGDKIEKKLKPIPKKQTDNRKKNTKRKITKAVAEYVLGRDKVCIICKQEQISQIHHCYFGESAVYTENRNDPDQLVGLCENCHTLLHFDGNHNHYRQECIEYVQDYYRKINTGNDIELIKNILG